VEGNSTTSFGVNVGKNPKACKTGKRYEERAQDQTGQKEVFTGLGAAREKPLDSALAAQSWKGSQEL